ncbi:MAG TPA: TonB-dependent receptor, partial [Longimicrobiales bacterium]|nr:TonB-dependent receptor [Longimicrobiales bacterium]
RWGNDVLGLRWDQPWGEWISTSRVGISRYTENFGMVDFDGLRYSSRLRQLFGRFDLARSLAIGSIRLGGEVSGLDAHNHFGGGGTSLWDEGDRGTMAGVFAQLGWRPTESWLLEPSLRVDLWAAADTSIALVSPRFAAKWFLGTDRDAAVKVAVGRYTQFLHSLKDETLPLSNDMWVLAGGVLPAVVSDQVQLGFEKFWGERWSASVEAYHRDFRGLVAFNPADDVNDPDDDYLTGTGRSYGLDLLVRKRSGRLTGWTTVSFLKADRTFADPLALGSGDEPPTVTYPPGFDRRVDIDLVLQFAGPRELEFGLRWNFGTGLPYTRPIAQSIAWEYDPPTGRFVVPIPTGGEEPDGPPLYVILGPRNGERYPAYHRLDLSVRKTLERRWGSYTPYLQILNAYNRKNPLFYFYHYDRSPATVSGLSMFPVLPTIGLEVTF